DRASAEDLASYRVESFTYKYHPVYGSPPVAVKQHRIRGVKVAEDGLSARLIVDSLEQHHIHTITLEGVREKERFYSLVHQTAYYTLHRIPSGAKLSLSEVSTKDSSIPVVTEEPTPAPVAAKQTDNSAKKPAAAQGN